MQVSACAEPLLSVRDLHVSYRLKGGLLGRAVNGLSFEVRGGEGVGIFGESGCGKSTTARAILRLLGQGSRCTGSIRFRGREILAANEIELGAIRGDQLALVDQDPSSCLHPALQARQQVAEILRAHRDWPARQRLAAAMERLRQFFAPGEVDRIAASYPFQLSGGQRQRVLLAQALACGPALVVADEPTASLDRVAESDVFRLLEGARQREPLAILLISHDAALLARVTQRMIVMYAGRIAETGPAREVLASPLHPYTRALLKCIPRPGEGGKPRSPIPGSPPDATAIPPGCPFHPRCAEATAECTVHPPHPVRIGERTVSCYRHAER